MLHDAHEPGYRLLMRWILANLKASQGGVIKVPISHSCLFPSKCIFNLLHSSLLLNQTLENLYVDTETQQTYHVRTISTTTCSEAAHEAVNIGVYRYNSN